MVSGAVRLFGGERPSVFLRRELQPGESCFARFADDPEGRVWVCARVGRKVFGTVLARDEEWLQPGGEPTFAGAVPCQPTRRLSKAA